MKALVDLFEEYAGQSVAALGLEEKKFSIGGFGVTFWTTYVTLPWMISSWATRHALIDFDAIIGGAPDCSCRARRAAPFTRLYLFWNEFSGVSSVIGLTSYP